MISRLVRVLFRVSLSVGHVCLDFVLADRGLTITVSIGDRRWIGGVGRVA